MDAAGLVIQLVSGAVGGNVAGALLKKFSVGAFGNSVVGFLGADIVRLLLKMLGVGGAGMGEGAMDVGSILSRVAVGGLSGGVVVAISSVVRKMVSKSS